LRQTIELRQHVKGAALVQGQPQDDHPRTTALAG
jgi:hypothetical protein